MRVYVGSLTRQWITAICISRMWYQTQGRTRIQAQSLQIQLNRPMIPEQMTLAVPLLLRKSATE